MTDMYRDDKISKEAYDDKYSEIGNKLEKKSIYFLTAYYHRRILQINKMKLIRQKLQKRCLLQVE